MKARERLARTRLQLGAAATIAAVLWGAAATVLGMAVSVVLGLLRGSAFAPAEVLALGAGVAVAAVLLMRLRTLHSAEQVALWIEERQPALRYALVTLAGGQRLTAGVAEALEATVAAENWSDPVRTAVARAILVPVAATALASASLAFALTPLGAGLVARTAAAARGPVRANGGSGTISGIVARVTPPAYTGLRPYNLADPSVIGAVEGSGVALEGSAARGAALAVLGTDTVRAAASDGRWRVALAMPESALALRLAQGRAERLVILEPVPDSAPAVTLTAPARDTVLRAPSGRVTLTADVRDDLGLAESWFELIVSSGERESFTFRTAVLARQPMGGARAARRRLVLPLDSLRLLAGDVLSLRVVARDRNPAPSRGVGVSETRTVRIARPGEYDSLALEGLPPIMGDTAALSQRMLIMLAEALQGRRLRLARDTVVAESRRIARDQAQLRRRVADIIFMRLGDEASGEETEGADAAELDTPEAVMAAAESAASRDQSAAIDFAESETPVVAVNRPLLEAYNAMWAATRELEVGEPDDALPHMRAALAAIQRARQAERIYLRGRPPVVVVDIAAVRLAGDRAGAGGSTRTAGAALAGERVRLAQRFAAAVALLEDGGGAAVDSLLLLRLEALRSEPRFVEALGRAAAALRAGRDATSALLDARQALGGHEAAAGALPAWSGAW